MTPAVIQTQESDFSKSLQSDSNSTDILSNADDRTSTSDISTDHCIGEDDKQDKKVIHAKHEDEANKRSNQRDSTTGTDPSENKQKRKPGNGTGDGSVGTLSSSDFNLSSLVGRCAENTLKNEKGSKEGEQSDDDCTVAMEGGDGGNSREEGSGNANQSFSGGNSNGNGGYGNDDDDEESECPWDDDVLDPFREPKRACRRAKCPDCGQYCDRCFEIVFGTYCLLAAVHGNEIGNVENDTPYRDVLRESYFTAYRAAVHFYAYQQSGLFDIQNDFAPPACMLQGSFREMIDLYRNVVRVRNYQASVRLSVVESLVENGNARHPNHWLTL